MILGGKGAIRLLEKLSPDKVWVCPFLQDFPDGEIAMQSISKVDFLMQSCYPNPNKRILELLLMAGLSRHPLVALVPYLAYSRQSLLLKSLFSCIRNTKIHRLITIDLHEEYSFLPSSVVNLETTSLLSKIALDYDILIAPDKGARSRVVKLATITQQDTCYLHKIRSSDNKIQFIMDDCEVKGKNCLIIDDILATGETIHQTSQKLLDAGANSVSAFVTHTLLNRNILHKIEKMPLQKFYTTDSIGYHKLPNFIHQISIMPLLQDFLY
jgi:ribose-phosphate pyrophosphokinase